jgi:hypothetical protein
MQIASPSAEGGAACSGAFALLADELVVHIASFLDGRLHDIAAWGATCRRLRRVAGDASLWRPACVAAEPELAACTPERWGRDWRSLWAAWSHALHTPCLVTEGVPSDRTSVIAGRRCVQPQLIRIVLAKGGPPQTDVIYVGEMDAGYNPHGYGLLFFRGSFVPHAPRPASDPAIAEGDDDDDDDGDKKKTRGKNVLPAPSRSIAADVRVRLVLEKNTDRSVPAFRTDEEHDRIQAERAKEVNPDGSMTFAAFLARGINSMREPWFDDGVSAGDRYEGLWHRGKFRDGVVRAYDRRKEHYYEGEVKEGLYDGRGRATSLRGDAYDGEWRAGERHGRGTVLLAAGDLIECDWTDGKPSGAAVVRRPSGAVYEIDSYGQVRVSLPDGSSIEGEWTRCDIGQHVVHRRADGSRYEGQWAGAEPCYRAHGRGIHYDAHGFMLDTEWHEGRPDGEGTLFHGPYGLMRIFTLSRHRTLVYVASDHLDEALAGADRCLATEERSRASPKAHSDGDSGDETEEVTIVAHGPASGDRAAWMAAAEHAAVASVIVPARSTLPCFFARVARAYRTATAAA